MPEISIRITNLPQIKRAFRLAPHAMSKEMNLAIRRIVLTVGGDSRRRTPVRTGRLRASHYERFGNLRGEIGTNTAYDRFVHWGTRYMKPRPYLKEAVEANSMYVDRQFTNAVDKALGWIARQT